jgi:hypothetical protein
MMANEPKDGGPAFPKSDNHWPESGMSLRDWFAGQALAGMASISLEDGDMIMGWADMSKAAYRAADAMLAARA